METNKRLYRSAKSKVFGGVAGGIAEYFEIDPIIIRLLFVVLVFAGGGGFLVYLILWIALPLEPITPYTMNMNSGSSAYSDMPGDEPKPDNTADMSNPFAKPVKTENKSGLIGGILLISLGLIFLANRFLPNINFGDLWPLILVVLGGVLIATSFAEHKGTKNE